MISLDRHDALDLDLYRRIVRDGEPVEVAPELLRAVDERRGAMLRALEGGATAYGVTTGLGYLAKREIPREDQPALQRSILLGRSVGVGEPFSREVVRGAMLLRLTGFLSGDAGVTSDLCGLLAERLNDGWTPYVPTGPHGSAGEVIPLSHLFQTLVGEGFVVEDGERVPAAEALAARGAVPYGTMSAVELDLLSVMSKVVVDDWEQCKPGGRFGALRAHVDQGLLTEETLHGELADVVVGRVPGRERDDERILFWHRGLATCDVALGALLVERAVEQGVGTVLRR